MRVTFVALSSEQLGISQLSAIAKQHGHEVRLAFSPVLFNDRRHLTIPLLDVLFDDRSIVLKTIIAQKPDVLALSAVSGTYQWLLDISRRTKKLLPNIKIIFGGVHPTAVPERVLRQPVVDYVCAGEGDIAFPQILKAIAQGRPAGLLPNTSYKSDGGQIIRGPQIGFVQDLDSLPFFDKTIWEDYIRIKDSYLTMASRGCPYRCTYCFNNFFARLPGENPGKYVRYRSVGHMMAELRQAKKRYAIRHVEFFDDVFTFNKVWLKNFLTEYKRDIGVPFQCFTHVKHVDEDIGRWLAEAGCFSTQIGIQSMDDDYKAKVIKRTEKMADVEKAIKILKRHKVQPKMDHMLGLPGEPIAALEKTREFYVETPPFHIQSYWTNYYPGTELQKQAFDLGILSADDVEKLNEGLGMDTFTNSNHTIPRENVGIYKRYEFIFTLLPRLPLKLRKALTPRNVRWMPVWLCSAVTFWWELLVGLVKWEVDHEVYIKHYLYHLYRFVFLKLGLKPLPATQPLSAKFVFQPPDATGLSKEETFPA